MVEGDRKLLGKRRIFEGPGSGPLLHVACFTGAARRLTYRGHCLVKVVLLVAAFQSGSRV